LRNLFFSFTGRLGRLGFLLRGMALGNTAGVLLIVGFTLFVHGALWWLGLVIAVIALAVLVVGYASLVVAPAARHEFLRLSRNLGDARATAWDARPCGHIGL
jgi:hypothetical protein